MSKLLILSGDLMLLSTLHGIAKQCGLESIQAGNVQAALDNGDQDCRVAFIDLQLPGLQIIEDAARLRESFERLSLIACGPHVHAARLEAAKQAGCDYVVSRGQFDREGLQLIAELTQP